MNRVLERILVLDGSVPYEGQIVGRNIVEGPVAKPDYASIPSAVYTVPALASVGLTEAKAREAGYKVKVGKVPFTAIAKAKIEDASDGFVKIVADETYGEILGVHMIGNTVTEMIAEAVAAIALEGTVDDLVNTIHAHPTLSEATHEAMENVFGAAIHL